MHRRDFMKWAGLGVANLLSGGRIANQIHPETSNSQTYPPECFPAATENLSQIYIQSTNAFRKLEFGDEPDSLAEKCDIYLEESGIPLDENIIKESIKWGLESFDKYYGLGEMFESGTRPFDVNSDLQAEPVPMQIIIVNDVISGNPNDYLGRILDTSFTNSTVGNESCQIVNYADESVSQPVVKIKLSTLYDLQLKEKVERGFASSDEMSIYVAALTGFWEEQHHTWERLNFDWQGKVQEVSTSLGFRYREINAQIANQLAINSYAKDIDQNTLPNVAYGSNARELFQVIIKELLTPGDNEVEISTQSGPYGIGQMIGLALSDNFYGYIRNTITTKDWIEFEKSLSELYNSGTLNQDNFDTEYWKCVSSYFNRYHNTTLPDSNAEFVLKIYDSLSQLADDPERNKNFPEGSKNWLESLKESRVTGYLIAGFLEFPDNFILLNENTNTNALTNMNWSPLALYLNTRSNVYLSTEFLVMDSHGKVELLGEGIYTFPKGIITICPKEQTASYTVGVHSADY